MLSFTDIFTINKIKFWSMIERLDKTKIFSLSNSKLRLKLKFNYKQSILITFYIESEIIRKFITSISKITLTIKRDLILFKTNNFFPLFRLIIIIIIIEVL